MTWNDLVDKLSKEFPGFKVVVKGDSKPMKFLNFFIRLWNPDYMKRYTTVFGKTVYMPKYLIGTDTGVEILRHEAVHIRDYQKWGPIFVLTYAFLPLPVVITGRAYWEFRGYVESMRAEYEQYGTVPDYSIDFYTRQFTSASYLWMFPFPKTVRGWFVKARNKILSGQ